MIVYELVHAAIGSNRALSTLDQLNTGYIGIGVIFAMLLLSLIFSVYLLYKNIKGLYNGHKKNGFKFINDTDKDKDKLRHDEEEEAVLRNQATGRS